MNVLDKILLNEISHATACRFYLVCKNNFDNDFFKEEDYQKFKQFNLLEKHTHANGSEVIKTTQLGDLFYHRISGFLASQRFEFVHDRIIFFDPFFP